MRLILVRHGETEGNVRKHNQGQQHGELTKRGIEQAKRTALRLKDTKIDKIYVSDLKRAVDTAAEIIKFHPKTEVTYEPALREQCHGIYEGSPYGTIGKAAEKAGVKKHHFKPEGGESVVELQERITTFLHKIIHKHKNETVLIVSHGGTIRFFLIGFLKAPEEQWEDYKHENCAVTELDIDEKGHKILNFKCIKHLTGIGTQTGAPT